MHTQKEQSKLWSNIISLVASLLIGLDIFVFFYLFSFKVIGVIPAIFISTCGFLLNTYLYYIDGPKSLIDFWLTSEKSFWSSFFDLISFLGALLIFVFTYYVYAEMIFIYPALAFWFTPFLVTIMAISDSLGTLTMNKSGFLHMLNDYPAKGFMDALSVWYHAFKQFCTDVIYAGKPHFDMSSLKRALVNIIFPITMGFIVTFSFTKIYLFGALAIMHGSFYSFLVVPFLWVSAIAFFIGEFYFVCEQNIQLMRSPNMTYQDNWWHLVNLGIDLLIVANAIANGFIALESSIFLSTWGIIRFAATCFQNYYVIKNKRNQFPGFEEMNNNQSGYILPRTLIILVCLLLVYIAQLPFANLFFPGCGMLPIFVVTIAISFFLGISCLGVEFLAPSISLSTKPTPIMSNGVLTYKNPKDVNNDVSVEEDLDKNKPLDLRPIRKN